MESSSSRTSISVDSLEEEDKKRKLSKIVKNAEENTETILVPFYEKDVLIRVPKQNKLIKENKHNKKEAKLQESRNYLVNKDLQKNKKSSYLEMFRKQFSSLNIKGSNNIENNEIRSISPQVGDTSNESIGGESSNQVNEFYNTESYNEIYYDKLINGDFEQYLNESFEEDLDLNTDEAYNNLKSVSEVSQPRRNIRRTIEPQIQNVRLGGLGPDMENIKPRLERSRSLQRYSEKVRMENRVKIYKKAHDINDIKIKKEKVPKNKKIDQDSSQNSYLINKILQENIYKNVCDEKTKSANVMRKREKNNQKNKNCTNAIAPTKDSSIDKHKDDNTKIIKNRGKTLSAKCSEFCRNTNNRDSRAKSSTKSRTADVDLESDSPLHINFLVNVGEVRPSSALKFLEEKHRLYQEKIKSFTNSQNQ